LIETEAQKNTRFEYKKEKGEGWQAGGGETWRWESRQDETRPPKNNEGTNNGGDGSNKSGKKQIKEIETEMARTQKNKATSYHLGQLKAKLAKLKRELLMPSGGGGGGGAGFDVARTGVASIGFIGFPSVGKSTLMSKLTGQHSEAAAYEFTTLTSVPGQVTYNGKWASVFACAERIREGG